MRPTALLACIVPLGSLAVACGPERLPPPAAPAQEIPHGVDVPDEPPAPGTGRVILDANGDKAKVVEITGSATAVSGGYRASVVGIRPLCTTPCVLDLPYGTHPLMLESTADETRRSEAELEVGPRPKIFRHSLGERKTGGAIGTVGSSLLALGVVTGLTGALFWGVGEMSSSQGHTSSLTGTGQLLTGLGAGGVVLSIPMLLIGRPTERPSATTEWSLPGAPQRPAPGGSTVTTRLDL